MARAGKTAPAAVPTRQSPPATPVPRVRVMLSSRNNDLIPDGERAIALSEVRKALQAELQAERLCGQPLLEVWINEGAGAEGGDASAWDQCLARVQEADVVVVIYNGQAGWTRDGAGVGICHAELARALDVHPAKVRLIRLRFLSDRARKVLSPDDVAKADEKNRAFARYLDDNNLFFGEASDRASLEREVRLAVVKAVAQLVRLGRAEARRGRDFLGSPLDWSRLSYRERKAELERALAAYLTTARGGRPVADGLTGRLGDQEVLWRLHGVPAGFAVAEARELIGRPHLTDHASSVVQDARLAGPVHVIACHKGCTETQIKTFMGQPDLFVVNPPFGWFSADRTTFAQVFFLTHGRDATATTLAAQRMFEWIGQSGELPALARRARSHG